MITLVTGGEFSGKAGWVLKQTAHFSEKYLIDAGKSGDDEFTDAVRNEKTDLGCITIDEPIRIPHSLRELYAISESKRCVIVDSLNTWVKNLYHAQLDIEQAFDDLQNALKRVSLPTFFIGCESGSGLIAEGDLIQRQYLYDVAMINRKIAELSDWAVILVSGFPITVKDNLRNANA